MIENIGGAHTTRRDSEGCTVYWMRGMNNTSQPRSLADDVSLEHWVHHGSLSVDQYVLVVPSQARQACGASFNDMMGGCEEGVGRVPCDNVPTGRRK